eukprot:g36188.t1
MPTTPVAIPRYWTPTYCRVQLCPKSSGSCFKLCLAKPIPPPSSYAIGCGLRTGPNTIGASSSLISVLLQLSTWGLVPFGGSDKLSRYYTDQNLTPTIAIWLSRCTAFFQQSASLHCYSSSNLPRCTAILLAICLAALFF